jgi:NADH:ubiquinone oxidoreductase subunit B-like Fe-S oxidoreductase
MCSPGVETYASMLMVLLERIEREIATNAKSESERDTESKNERQYKNEEGSERYRRKHSPDDEG